MGLGALSEKQVQAGGTSFPAFRILREKILILFIHSNAGAGHSPFEAQDQRLRNSCRRFSKLDATFRSFMVVGT